MGLSYELALVLTLVSLTTGQYGPIKGPATRRTTTPFPPGFQSDNEIYNGPSAGSPDNTLGSHSFSYQDKTGSLSGSSSSASSNQPGTSFSSSSSSFPGSSFSTSGSAPPVSPGSGGSGYGNLPSSNQRPSIGAVSTLDNPWLSGIVAQNAGNRPSGSGGCSGGNYGGGCSSPSSPSSSSFQQTSPTVTCNNPGLVCVPKNQCIGGKTSSPDSGLKQCDLNTEVCCQQSHKPEDATYPGQTGYPGQFSRPGTSSQLGQAGYYPGQPGQPTHSGQSGQAGFYPGQPGRPGQGGSYPVKPVQPGPSGRPGSGSFYPEQPGQAGAYPGQPGQPGQSGQPVQPGPSGRPGSGSFYPEQPGQPGQSGQPVQPGPSGRPGSGSFYPEQPGQAGSYPGQPGKPGRPGQEGSYPGQPGRPGQGGSYPGQPGQPGQGGSYPGQPGRPGQGGSYPGQPGRPGQGGSYPGQPGRPGQGGSYPGQPGRPGQGGSYPGQQGFPTQPGTGGVPIGGSIYDTRPVSQAPSNYVTEAPVGPYTGPLNTTPHVGCPAALKCVEEIYCTWDGIMSDTPVTLTREQAENKVPLSECQNIETGIIGKCCRDPNYEDPWPSDTTHGGNHGHDDGQYHGPEADHGFGAQHGAGAHHPQGIGFDSCGSSATCTAENECTGERQIQPGKQCRVPAIGSTGVCCKKLQLPTGSSNLQTLPTASHRPSPGHQYYSPKPQGSKNPFLPENVGKPSTQKPNYSTPTQYSPSQPNVIFGGGKKDSGYFPDIKPSPNTLLLEENKNLQNLLLRPSTPLVGTVQTVDLGRNQLTQEQKRPSSSVYQSSTPSTSISVEGNSPLTSVSKSSVGVPNQYLPSISLSTPGQGHFPVDQQGQLGQSGTSDRGSFLQSTTSRPGFDYSTTSQLGFSSSVTKGSSQTVTPDYDFNSITGKPGYLSRPNQPKPSGSQSTFAQPGQSSQLGASEFSTAQAGQPGPHAFGQSSPVKGSSKFSSTTPISSFSQSITEQQRKPGSSIQQGVSGTFGQSEIPKQSVQTYQPKQSGQSNIFGIPNQSGKPGFGLSGSLGQSGHQSTSGLTSHAAQPGQFGALGTSSIQSSLVGIPNQASYPKPTTSPSIVKGTPGFQQTSSKTSLGQYLPPSVQAPGSLGSPDQIGNVGNLKKPSQLGVQGTPGKSGQSVYSDRFTPVTTGSVSFHTTPTPIFGQSTSGQFSRPSQPGQISALGAPNQSVQPEYFGQRGVSGSFGRPALSGQFGAKGQIEYHSTPKVPGVSSSFDQTTPLKGSSVFSYTTSTPGFRQSSPRQPGYPSTPSKIAQTGISEPFSRSSQTGDFTVQPGQRGTLGVSGVDTYSSQPSLVTGNSIFSHTTPSSVFGQSTSGQSKIPENTNNLRQSSHSYTSDRPSFPGQLTPTLKPGFGQYSPSTKTKVGQTGQPSFPGISSYTSQSNTQNRGSSLISHTTSTPVFGYSVPSQSISGTFGQSGQSGHLNILGQPGHLSQFGQPKHPGIPGFQDQSDYFTSPTPQKGGSTFLQTTLTPAFDQKEQTGHLSGISSGSQSTVRPDTGQYTSSHFASPISHTGTFGQLGHSGVLGSPNQQGQQKFPSGQSFAQNIPNFQQTTEKPALSFSNKYLPSKSSTISGQELISQSPQKAPSGLYSPAQENVIPIGGKVSSPLPSFGQSPIPSSTPSSLAYSTTISSISTYGSSPQPYDRITPDSGYSTPSTTSGGKAPAFGSNAGIYSTAGSPGAPPKGPPAGYPFLDLTTLSPAGGRLKPLPSSVSYEPGKDCGVRRQVSRPNGPDGLEAGFGEFPWQAQIILSSDQNPICSGAILSDRVIVTSAHCLNELRSDDLMVKVGDWKLGTENPSEEPRPTQIRQVAAVARHPNYDPVSRFNDVAVLILSETLNLDSNVDVLCLGDVNAQGQKPRGNTCVVTGWGKDNLQGKTGGVLHSIPVNFIENEQCENAFRETFLGKYFQLHKSFTCILPVKSNQDLCKVDTGSPIACQKPDGRYELGGIYSWDVGCHPDSNIPSASANVDKKWVDSVMRKPVEQVRKEEEEERERTENLGFNPNESDLTKPGFSQGYGK